MIVVLDVKLFPDGWTMLMILADGYVFLQVVSGCDSYYRSAHHVPCGFSMIVELSTVRGKHVG